jgi:hypothetical protein
MDIRDVAVGDTVYLKNNIKFYTDSTLVAVRMSVKEILTYHPTRAYGADVRQGKTLIVCQWYDTQGRICEAKFDSRQLTLEQN